MDRMERSPMAHRAAPESDMIGLLNDSQGCRSERLFLPARRSPCPTLKRGIGAVILLITVTAVLSSCGMGASARTTHSGPTPDISATQTVQTEQRGPGTVQVSAQVKGSLAARTSTLISQVTVTNHTSQLIHLAFACPPPAIDLTLMPEGQSGPGLDVSDLGVNCLLPDVNYTFFDIDPSIGPGNVHTWMLTNLLCLPGGCPLQAGTNVLTAIVANWHQGTIKQFNANVPVLHGSAQGQMVITLA